MTYQNDPNFNRRPVPPPIEDRSNSDSMLLWIIGGAAALALVAFLAFGTGMSNKDVATNTDRPAATTTGSSNTSGIDRPAAPGSTMNNNARELPSTTESAATPGRQPTDNPVDPR